jgi:zinc-ribbon domain
MMRCVDCGEEHPASARFCSACGVLLLVVSTFRPGYHAPCAHGAHYAQLPLLFLAIGDHGRAAEIAALVGAS